MVSLIGFFVFSVTDLSTNSTSSCCHDRFLMMIETIRVSINYIEKKCKCQLVKGLKVELHTV